MSDEEYDKLFNELVGLETLHPELVTRQSPTQIVGSSLRKGKNGVDLITHKTPMLSLANAFSMEEMEAFDVRVKRMSETPTLSYVVEFKYDGIALAVHYDKGKFVRAITRGDGKMGEDVSGAIRRFLPSLTRDLVNWEVHGAQIEIRGEAFLTRDQFKRLNTSSTKTFTNPRNLASGLLKRKSSSAEVSEVPSANLSFIGYNMIAERTPNTHAALLDSIASLGLPTGHPHVKVLSKIEEFEALEREWASKRTQLDFEADGMVLKVNEIDVYDRLGFTSHSPRFAIAWKFSAKQATTSLNSIELSVGRTGKITPVANVSPVQLAGSIISRATLHNRTFLENLRLLPGCRVIIERSGDVIPKIVGRVDDSNQTPASEVLPPLDWTICPCERRQPLTPIGNVDFACTSLDCLPQRQRQLEHFCSALDIEGLGPSSLKQLSELGLITQFGDIFRLKDQNLAKLRARDGWGQKKIENMIRQIEAAKSRSSLSALLFAIGIPHIGKETAATLASKVGTIENLLNYSTEALQQLDDIGPVVAQSIATYLSYPASKSTLLDLASLGIGNIASDQKTPETSTGPSASALSGKNVVFTGSLSSMSRKEAENLVKSVGGEVKSTTTKNTDYLVEGKAPSTSGSTSSKLKAAQSMGVAVLSEDEFFSLIRSPVK